LDDELVENLMKPGAGVRPPANAVRQYGDEVGHRSRHRFAEKSDFDPSQIVARYFHVQVRHVGNPERLPRVRLFYPFENNDNYR